MAILAIGASDQPGHIVKPGPGWSTNLAAGISASAVVAFLTLYLETCTLTRAPATT